MFVDLKPNVYNNQLLEFYIRDPGTSFWVGQMSILSF